MANKQQQLAFRKQSSSHVNKNHLTRMPSFNDNKDAASSFSMLKNFTDKPQQFSESEMAANKQHQQGIHGQKCMTRSPSFSEWNCAWKDSEGSFSMLKNMAEKPRVKIETPLDEPQHPVVNCVVPKGQRTHRKDSRKAPNQCAATQARGPRPEHNIIRPTNTIPNSCLGRKRKEPDVDLSINALIVKTMDSHFCEVCQTSCSGDWIFNQHLGGAAHKSKLEYVEKKYSCNLCKIDCTDGDSLKRHLNGKKHMTKKNKLQNGVQKPLHCELCLVNCIDMDSFQAHLAGKSHAAKLKLCA